MIFLIVCVHTHKKLQGKYVSHGVCVKLEPSPEDLSLGLRLHLVEESNWPLNFSPEFDIHAPNAMNMFTCTNTDTHTK